MAFHHRSTAGVSFRAITAWLAIAAAILLASPVSADARSTERYVVIDTQKQSAVVYDGWKILATFGYVAIGNGGAAPSRRAGDGRTPLGEFRINHINLDSKFHIFLGLDYPTLEHAERALQDGLISEYEYLDFISNYRAQGKPPQNSSLGGSIGIHGIGGGDPRVHRIANWTEGCIALTNEEIEQLAQLIHIGTRVVIR